MRLLHRLLAGLGSPGNAVPELPHDYPVLLRRLRPEEGGGYLATIPQLGAAAYVGDGETPAEALRQLNACWELLAPDRPEPLPPVQDETRIEQLLYMDQKCPGWLRRWIRSWASDRPD